MISATVTAVAGSLLRIAHQAILRGLNEKKDINAEQSVDIHQILSGIGDQINNLSKSIDRLTDKIGEIKGSVDRISDTILLVATYGPSIEASGHVQLAIRALNAGVFDVAIEELNKAENLDKTAPDLWITYLILRIKLLFANPKLLSQINHLPSLEIERAFKFILANASKDSKKDLILLLYYLFEISCLFQEQAATDVIATNIVDLLVTEKIINLENSEIYLVPLLNSADSVKHNANVRVCLEYLRGQFRASLEEKRRSVASNIAEGYTMHSMGLGELLKSSRWLISRDEIAQLEAADSNISEILKDYNAIVGSLEKLRGEMEFEYRAYIEGYADFLFSKMGCLPVILLIIGLVIFFEFFAASPLFLDNYVEVVALFVALFFFSLILPYALYFIFLKFYEYKRNSNYRQFKRHRLADLDFKISLINEKRIAEVERVRPVLEKLQIHIQT